jgi:hypothetical protein
MLPGLRHRSKQPRIPLPAPSKTPTHRAINSVISAIDVPHDALAHGSPRESLHYRYYSPLVVEGWLESDRGDQKVNSECGGSGH